MKKTETKAKTNACCRCGRKAMYTVEVIYSWRGTVITPSGEPPQVFSEADCTAIDVCEDCYPDTMLQIEAKTPALS